MEKKIYYKGFDKNFQCRGFQYEIGKSYTHKGEIKPCKSGFHACEYPLSVFNYYAPANSRFSEVEARGKIVPYDEKIACEKLKIKAEISLNAMITAAVKFTLSKIKTSNTATNTGAYSVATNTGAYSAATNTGDYSVATNTSAYSAATNTGYQSAATNTGYYSVATNTGKYSAATAAGKDSIACGLGYKCKAKGAKGCWLVLAERDEHGKILNVKTFCVDGKNIKENFFYVLENGKLTEAE